MPTKSQRALDALMNYDPQESAYQALVGLLANSIHLMGEETVTNALYSAKMRAAFDRNVLGVVQEVGE